MKKKKSWNFFGFTLKPILIIFMLFRFYTTGFVSTYEQIISLKLWLLLFRMYFSNLFLLLISTVIDFFLSLFLSFSLFFSSVMEYPVTETGSTFTSGIKRHVKDKRIPRTAKLNVSLASKIKTKIISKCH